MTVQAIVSDGDHHMHCLHRDVLAQHAELLSCIHFVSQQAAAVPSPAWTKQQLAKHAAAAASKACSRRWVCCWFDSTWTLDEVSDSLGPTVEVVCR